jgi:hypothetical protein
MDIFRSSIPVAGRLANAPQSITPFRRRYGACVPALRQCGRIFAILRIPASSRRQRGGRSSAVTGMEKEAVDPAASTRQAAWFPSCSRSYDLTIPDLVCDGSNFDGEPALGDSSWSRSPDHREGARSGFLSGQGTPLGDRFVADRSRLGLRCGPLCPLVLAGPFSRWGVALAGEFDAGRLFRP